MGFLRRCEEWHSPASVELAKQYLAARPMQDGNEAREALRWFVRAARKAEVGRRSDGRTVSDPLAHAPAFARGATAGRRGYGEDGTPR